MINIFKILETVVLSRALYVACDLDLADALAERSMQIKELCELTGTNQDALTRLMNLLCLNQVFYKSEDNFYVNTDFSETMVATHPNTIKPFLLHDDESRWNSLGDLTHSIRTGKASFNQLYQTDYFSSLKSDMKLSKRFDEAMLIISRQEDAIIAKSISFNGIVADIGGGNGQLLNEILSKHPKVTGAILFDLPNVENKLIYQNASKVVGSFFDEVNIKANDYILKRILHDWNDQQAELILKNVESSMGVDARLFIFEGLLDVSKNAKLLSSIDLYLLTILAGKERSLDNFKALLAKANLEVRAVHELTDLMFALECKKITQ